jgi:hypothetical protein
MVNFFKALKVESVELKEELTWTYVENFLNYVWHEGIIKELQPSKWNFEKFVDAIFAELENRNWDIRNFRNSKNEPITNIFKRLLKIIAKDENREMSNDSLSRILNLVRKQYTTAGQIISGLFPPIAFRERSSYGIPEDLGDTNSCFLSNGCNEGNVDWLLLEYEKFKRAYFVVFYYRQGTREGWGRCWAYRIEGGVFATNFYSRAFEIKEDSYKFVLVRLLRKLFDLSDNVKFAVGKTAPLPIYLNKDGIIIYEPTKYENSAEILDAIGHLESECLWCGEIENVKNLCRYDETVKYEGRKIKGLIVCKYCESRLDDMKPCYECGEYDDREEMIYVENYGYVCQSCFEDYWFICEECEEVERRDHAIFTPDQRWLCEYCASRIGALCGVCGQYYYFDEYANDETSVKEYKIIKESWSVKVFLCSKCAQEHLKKYQCQCGQTVHYLDIDFMLSTKLREMVRLDFCLECYHKKRREMYENAFENREHPSLFAVMEENERVLMQILVESD